ncbi:MAG TPA: hypothetical protein VLA64_05860 [Azonexus sp.]|nr:hypothetical protein [Azonexus sp.]
MKALVFLLLLFNLLFYAFTQGYFGRTENPDAGRIEKQVLAERMRIVSRGEVSAAPVKAPEPVKPEVVPDIPKIEPESKTDEIAPICLVWEHLSVSDADQLNTLISSKFTEFKVERQGAAGEANGWWVFTPALPSKLEAEKKAGELRQLGVTDYFIILDGPNRFAISLGVYSSEKGAQERLAEAKEKGIRSARLAPRPGKDGTVSLLAKGPAEGKVGLLEAVGKILPKTNAQSCK